MNLTNFTYKLLSVKGIGRVKANSILDTLANSFNIKNWSENEILSKIGKEIAEGYMKVDEKVEHELKQAKEEGVKFITILDTNYPQNLKQLGTNRPTIISYRGNINLLNTKKVGFCGSRKASDKGLSVAMDVSQQVSKKGISVVSGYASGIDQQTHYWSLKEKGNTIIVLPEGISHFKIKSFVKEVWDWNRVLIISEFMPNAIWSAGRAMERNLTIVALSDVMVLIEARETGGSIDAGNKSLSIGKPLFAPVYEGMPPEASGNQILLSKGALPLKRKKETNRANLDFMFGLMNELATMELKMSTKAPKIKINSKSILFKQIHLNKGNIHQISFEFKWSYADYTDSTIVSASKPFSPSSYVDMYKPEINNTTIFRDQEYVPLFTFENLAGDVEITATSRDNSEFELTLFGVEDPISI